MLRRLQPRRKIMFGLDLFVLLLFVLLTSTMFYTWAVNHMGAEVPGFTGLWGFGGLSRSIGCRAILGGGLAC